MLCVFLITICVLFSNFPRCKPQTKPKLKHHSHNRTDLMGESDKRKIQALAKELVIDAKLHQRKIKEIREVHEEFISYEVGLVIGKIREKYKRMMEVYREARDASYFHPDSIRPQTVNLSFSSIHYLLYMETIRKLEMDIDKQIQILEKIPVELLNKQSSETTTPSDSRMLRNRHQHLSLNESNTNHLTEEKVKQAYKEQYYAKKRNQNWTLDDYYGLPG